MLVKIGLFKYIPLFLGSEITLMQEGGTTWEPLLPEQQQKQPEQQRRQEMDLPNSSELTKEQKSKKSKLKRDLSMYVLLQESTKVKDVQQILQLIHKVKFWICYNFNLRKGFTVLYWEYMWEMFESLRLI